MFPLNIQTPFSNRIYKITNEISNNTSEAEKERERDSARDKNILCKQSKAFLKSKKNNITNELLDHITDRDKDKKRETGCGSLSNRNCFGSARVDERLGKCCWHASEEMKNFSM